MSASDTSQMILASNTTSSVNKYFNTSSQRLQRYIADIQKGFVIIVVAGAILFYNDSCARTYTRSDFGTRKIRAIKPRDACAGLVGGLLLSLIWMILLRFSAGLMAWLLIIAVNLTFAACTLLAFTKVRTLPLLAYLPLFCHLNKCHVQHKCEAHKTPLNLCWCRQVYWGILGRWACMYGIRYHSVRILARMTGRFGRFAPTWQWHSLVSSSFSL